MKTAFQKESEKQLARMNPGFIQTGIIKDNRDPKKMGRLKVWVEGSASAEDNKTGWVTCDYASPFAGRTQGQPNATKYSEYPKSYGFWATPPDVGTRVFVFFVNGKIEKSYWFSSPFDYMMNGMVPAPQTKVVGDSETDSPLPVIEFDRNTHRTDLEAEYLNVPLIDGLQKQKLLYDVQKGVPNRSARRQAPSQVYGLTSPRGNHIVLDDGFSEKELTAKTWDDDQDGYQDTEYGNPSNDTETGKRKDEGIVLRTRSGAQIAISETDGYVFIINRDGTARVEMDADGNVSIIGEKDVAIRAKQDINYYAERDMNIEVLRNMNVKVHGIHKTEVVGQTVAHYKDEVVLKLDKSIRLSVAETIRANAAKTVNLTGGENISMLGGGGLVTLSGDLSTTSVIKTSADVKTASVSLNNHVHTYGPTNVPVDTTPGKNGGGAGAPTDPEPADDIDVEDFELTKIDDVVSVSADSKVASKVVADIGKAAVTSLSSLCFVMPTTGSVSSSMYWGTDIKQPDGAVTDSSGWVINGSGSIVSVGPGYVLNVTGDTVHIDHKNGYHSMYKGIEVDASIMRGSDVTENQPIGTYKTQFLFEMRRSGSPLFGFKGSVDPGLFFVEVTQTGSQAAGASLTAGKATNPVCKASATTTATVSEIVNTVELESILPFIPQSGSTVKPPNKASAKAHLTTSSTLNVQLPNETVDAPFVAEPIEWVVDSSDKTLIDDVKQNEGSIKYQTKMGYFKQNKFFTYYDTEGFPTIGYGHLITGAVDYYRDGLSEAEADKVLDADLSEAVSSARSIAFAHRLRIPKTAQLVLTEMTFQLGKGGVLQFKQFLKALAAKNYQLAAEEMRSSLWYQQTPNRVEKHAKRIEQL